MSRSSRCARPVATGAIAVALTLLVGARPAGAAPPPAPPPSAENVEEARALLLEGNAQLHAGNHADALEKFERSLRLVPSPNTELLVGRALRELGRRVEAARAFANAEQEAQRRVQAGESKYTPTENAARSEGALVRAQLGTLRIRVADPKRTTLTVDGKPTVLAAQGDTTVLHEVGPAEVVVQHDGAEQKQGVTVVAGAIVQMEFTGQGPPRTDIHGDPATSGVSRPTATTSSMPWTTPAAVGAGAVALVGAGVFTFFGLRVESTWDDLSRRCGPTHCGAADRADADQAMTDQTVANVGLVVGSVAAAAAITFLVIGLTSHEPPSGRGGRPALVPSPRTAAVPWGRMWIDGRAP